MGIASYAAVATTSKNPIPVAMKNLPLLCHELVVDSWYAEGGCHVRMKAGQLCVRFRTVVMSVVVPVFVAAFASEKAEAIQTCQCDNCVYNPRYDAHSVCAAEDNSHQVETEKADKPPIHSTQYHQR
jgi:hypothetical protein